MRGELLTNGYKSLRAQGMLRAIKIDSNENGGDKTMIRKNSQSKELAHLNICIEKTYEKHINDSSESLSKRPAKVVTGSPLKVNPNLVPKGLAPKKQH